MRFYSDEYETLIDEVETFIGSDLEAEGKTQEFEIGSLHAYLLPAVGGYDRICVEFSVEESNYADPPEQLGCLDGSTGR